MILAYMNADHLMPFLTRPSYSLFEQPAPMALHSNIDPIFDHVTRPCNVYMQSSFGSWLLYLLNEACVIPGHRFYIFSREMWGFTGTLWYRHAMVWGSRNDLSFIIVTQHIRLIMRLKTWREQLVSIYWCNTWTTRTISLSTRGLGHTQMLIS